MHWSSAIVALLLGVCSCFAQDTSAFTKASNESLLWGPYRPNLYFGLRPRLPKSITTGLLWSRVEDFTEVQHLVRYTCEQNEDIEGYGWDKYDPRTGGVQTVHDKGNGIDLETSFVKFNEGRGGWGARVKGIIRADAEALMGSQNGAQENLKSTIWFTIGVEGLGRVEVLGAEAGEDKGFDRNVVFDGQTSDLGDFQITISERKENTRHPRHNHPSFRSKPLDRTLVHSVQVPDEALWQSKGISPRNRSR